MIDIKSKPETKNSEYLISDELLAKLLRDNSKQIKEYVKELNLADRKLIDTISEWLKQSQKEIDAVIKSKTTLDTSKSKKVKFIGVETPASELLRELIISYGSGPFGKKTEFTGTKRKLKIHSKQISPSDNVNLDPQKEKELIDRIKQLEAIVAQLQKTIQQEKSANDLVNDTLSNQVKQLEKPKPILKLKRKTVIVPQKEQKTH